ncbi:MAG: hypothetical protein KF749_18210 [Bacteroidetes bacterium]|nr:hypothetical protein [Bacteroidota bacterium]MCW5895559.1 hypothetical protein [Bacteroidota bacterium]
MNERMASERMISLDTVTQSVEHLERVQRKSVRQGDCVIVATCNSTYSLTAQEDGSYFVSGGWFDRMSPVPQAVRVNGCTWGGCIIKVDIVAAVGLCLEFSNRVTTSPIRKIVLIPKERQN